jgi:acyl-CoA synthetase (AMP-forming)/AMP-acid ligase II
MSQADPILQALMAKGAPFEVVEKGAVRMFRNAPENMGEIFDRARGFGCAEFIVYGTERLTFDEVFARADALSEWLVRDFGLKSQQSVGISMQNCPEWMIAFIAIINAGGVAVLINSRGIGTVMAHAIEDADCVLVIGDEKRLRRLSQAGHVGATLARRDFPRKFSEAATGFKPVRAAGDDLAAMFFTSGTTGRAKAAAIEHKALIAGMMNTQMAMAAVFQKMAAAYNIDVQTLRAQMPQSCSLLVFPLFHTSGCSSVFLTALTTGGKLVLMHRWEAEAAMSLIEREKITALGGVPAMHWDILRSPKFGRYDLSSLMSLSCGGQALPLNLLEEMRAAFPKAYIGAGYGMTETCGAVSQANGEAFLANPSASGQVLPMVDVQITAEDGTPLPIGAAGEIWVKGAIMMREYYGRPDATAAAFSGGWFKTGDIGKLDDQGYIYIVDRKTDMVISGGENIYCAEIEQAFGRHPAVREVTSFGVPDERLGERLVVQICAMGEITAQDFMDYARAELADYKVPADIVVSSAPFELNAMGKIEKHKVREAYLARKAS